VLVLGIETSCDETAVAIVDGTGKVRSQIVLSQVAEHRPYGGIVPEIAARSHLAHLDGLIAKAMTDAGVGFKDLSAVAATAGPGLIGGVIVGVMTAKAIAAVHKIPFIAVNHLEGHALTAHFSNDVAFPYLLLLVSGGHCQLLAVDGPGKYRRLGTTIDDAAGEAFDKVAKMIGLGYPGGPALARVAETGNPKRFAFPRPMKGKPGCDFSFSGLKTAVRTAVEELGTLSEVDVADVAASFQAAIVDAICDRVRRALAIFPEGQTLVAAGGVAANTALREALTQTAAKAGFAFVAPPIALCTDNAVMIAWAGLARARSGISDPLDFKPRPRWPLDPTAVPARGAGVKA
jgi:N6-L-threonylcarbamoyladenine synthase